MQFVFYAVIFLCVVTIVASFVQVLVFPPVVIGFDELPEEGQREVQNQFPQFEMGEVKHLRPRHRYVLSGSFGQHPGRIKLDMTPDGELAEMEFCDLSYRRKMIRKQAIPSTAIPSRIASLMEPFVHVPESEISSRRAWSGMINSENAYEIKFCAGEFEYDFLFTQSGRLIEYEKEHRDF